MATRSLPCRRKVPASEKQCELLSSHSPCYHSKYIINLYNNRILPQLISTHMQKKNQIYLYDNTSRAVMQFNRDFYLKSMFSGSIGKLSAQNQGKSKQYFKDNRLSGLYQGFDPKTGKLIEEGKFEYGEQTGLWKEIDADGDQIHYRFTKQRVGAICNDGSRSSATGRGACSWHGGVAQWLYESFKTKVGGTGKYVPIETRIQQLKEKAKAKLKTTKQGQELQQEVLKKLLSLLEQKQSFEGSSKTSTKEIQQKQDELKAANKTLKLKDQEIKSANKNLQLKDNQLKIAKNQVEKMSTEIEKLQKQVKELKKAVQQRQAVKEVQEKGKVNAIENKSTKVANQKEVKETIIEATSIDKLQKQKKTTSSEVSKTAGKEVGISQLKKKPANQLVEVKLEEYSRHENEDDINSDDGFDSDQQYDPKEEQRDVQYEEEEKYADQLSGSWEEDEEEGEKSREAKSRVSNQSASEAQLIKQLIAKLRLA